MNVLRKLSFKTRAFLLNRQIDALMRRANMPYRPSAHLVGVPPAPASLPDFSRSGWFLLALVVAGFFAGYVVADDKRIAELDAMATSRHLAQDCSATLASN